MAENYCTKRYGFQASIQVAKDEIFLMGCCVSSEGSAAASGNMALYN